MADKAGIDVARLSPPERSLLENFRLRLQNLGVSEADAQTYIGGPVRSALVDDSWLAANDLPRDRTTLPSQRRRRALEVVVEQLLSSLGKGHDAFLTGYHTDQDE
jgi:hypothetical protein